MKYILTFCLLSISAFAHSQNNNDSVAIVKLLEKAAITFRSGDAKAYADCWHVQPYSVILISSDDGKAMSIPAEALAQPSQYMGQGGFAAATNYRMSIHTDNGWVSFDEVSTTKTEHNLIPMKYGWLKKLIMNGSWLLHQCISINNNKLIIVL
jgi:hypothetical protein